MAWKRLLLVRGAELVAFAMLAALPLAVKNPYALGLLTLLAIYGILLIGMALGALESLASFYLGSGWREAPGLVLLILALAVRPTGVFGKAVIRKV